MGLRGVLKEFALFVVKLTIISTSATAEAKSGCQRNCGNITIPYPFGTGNDCSISSFFSIRCETPSNITTQKAFLTTSDNEVVHISLDGYLRIRGRPLRSAGNVSFANFRISHTRNRFTAIGCSIFAGIHDARGGQCLGGCAPFCTGAADFINGSCSGMGCCQTALPQGVSSYSLNFFLLNGAYGTSPSDNPGSYGFIVEDGAYSFSTSDYNNDFGDNELPIILDWTIGNQSCREAEMDPENYACKENSYCIDPENGPGYLCKCLDGFQGNPYLSHGCQDIDECDTLKPCTGTCYNVAGGYNCSCPEGFAGDGRKNGTGCIPITERHQIALIPIVALGVGLFFLLAVVWWLYRKLQRRKIIKRKQALFKRNGGLLLQNKLSSNEGGVEKTKLFTSKELDKATDKYNENRILGSGGQGLVYKGMLQDGRIVAVKKSKIVNEGYLDQFINEIVILSQIDHRNIVKLLGCCLETEVPLLVYEFIPNGTLSQLIHDQNEEYPRSWDVRLRIAAEVASAISYLHSSASVPIYHRDIKSSNILLDEKFRAKVSDFGTSRLIAIDQTHLTTQVQGTFGYLDPEYFQSSQFTEKSDVYSFGVVLVELLTGQKAISTFGSQEKRGLVSYFITSMDENQLLDTLDAQVVSDAQKEELVAIAQLAKRCLNLDGRYRPTMKEVAMELERIRIWQGYVPTQPKQEEFVVTKPTENWDFTSNSNLSYIDSSITSVLDVHPLMIDTI